MSPFFHTILMVLLATLSAFLGTSLGFAVYGTMGHGLVGNLAFPFLFLAGTLGPFFCVIYLWDRYVPALCPRCKGRMRKKGVGRAFWFTCPSCGHGQFG